MLIKSGEKGIVVKYLQYGLKIMCCYPGSIDSDFGPGTQAAVEKFQEEQGISVDGIVGDETWRCLAAEIKPIQRALKEKGFYSGAITGIAKEDTYSAVIKFQKRRQLKADGMVGSATRDRLFNEANENDELAMLPLTNGSRGNYVLNLQYGLKILCCSPGGLDGVFGSGTSAAVKKFQEKYNISITGEVNSTTWNKLKDKIRDIQSQLSNKGFYVSEIDGLATSALVELIKKFQEANWLTVDGQVGPSTMEVLMSDLPSGAMDAFPLSIGSRGPQVLYVQYALRINCINPNGTDGVYGNGTANAVTRYKTKKGLTADGIVDTATWEKMRDDIRPIQTALSNRGYNVGYVDGIATDMVYQAVLKFQTDNGLTADGMVGNSTKALLLGGTSGGGTVSSTLRLGSNGSLTRYLQRMLNELGYNIPVDGIFRASTRTAIIDFQTQHQLVADGVVGGGTWKALFNEYKVDVPGTGIEKMVNVAKHELSWGFKEDNANNITPYGQWYGMNGSPWCAMFVSFCAYQAGIIDELVPRYAWCPSGMTWYKNRGKYHKNNSDYIPKIGDIVFIYNSELGRVAHTGIVVGGDEHLLITIEGNTSEDAVSQCTRSRDNKSIDGFGDNGGTPISLPLSPTQEEIDSVLQAHFNDYLQSLGFSLQAPINYEINREVTIAHTTDFKLMVELNGDVSLMKPSESRRSTMTLTITDNGKIESGNLNVFDTLNINISTDPDVNSQATGLTKSLINEMSITAGPGPYTVDYGIRNDEEGTWFFQRHTVERTAHDYEQYPIGYTFSIVFCVKRDYDVSNAPQVARQYLDPMLDASLYPAGATPRVITNDDITQSIMRVVVYAGGILFGFCLMAALAGAAASLASAFAVSAGIALLFELIKSNVNNSGDAVA